MTQKPYLVGIVGGSGSGKTSFLRDLLARLPDNACAVVSQDNYYRPIQEQECDGNGQPNFDLPTAFRLDCFHDDLARLMRGEAVTRTEYTFNHRDRQGRPIKVVPTNVLFLEGLFLFHLEQIRSLLDLRVFIDARIDICKQRRLERDAKERGYPPEHVEYQWLNHVMPAYEKFVLPYREEAHIVVTNHASYEKGLEVVAHHVMAILKEPRTQ